MLLVFAAALRRFGLRRLDAALKDSKASTNFLPKSLA
jgi:hypothetical protein